MRWAGNESHMGKRRGAKRVLVGKLERKTPLGRPRRAMEEYIKMDLQEVGWENMGLIDLFLDRDRWEGSCQRGIELSGPIKCGAFLD